MISLTKISKFLKLNMIITLIIYAMMYIFLFAPYSADAYDYAQDGNGDFDFRKMLIFMVVGLGVSLAFIIYHVTGVVYNLQQPHSSHSAPPGIRFFRPGSRCVWSPPASCTG